MPTPQDVTAEDIFEEGEVPGTEEEEEERPEDEEELEEEEGQDEPEDEDQDEPEDEESSEEDEEPEDQEGEDEEDEDEEDGEPEPVTEQLKRQLGIDDLEDEEYEETVDGVMEMTRDAADALAQQKLNNTLSNFPEVQRLLEFRANGGDPEEYFETMTQPDWGDMEVQEDDLQTQKELIRRDMQEQGFEQDEIDESIEEYENSGVLYNEARRRKRLLSKRQEEEREQMIEQQRERREQMEQQREEFWDDVENTVREVNDIRGVPLPESRKEDFVSFLREPVAESEQGQPMTRRDQIAQNIDLETRLMMDWLLYVTEEQGMDMEDIIQREARSENAANLRDRLSQTNGEEKPRNRSNENRGSGGRDEDAVNNLDLDRLQNLGAN